MAAPVVKKLCILVTSDVVTLDTVSHPRHVADSPCVGPFQP
jgi:hypothetical protein